MYEMNENMGIIGTICGVIGGEILLKFLWFLTRVYQDCVGEKTQADESGPTPNFSRSRIKIKIHFICDKDEIVKLLPFPLKKNTNISIIHFST